MFSPWNFNSSLVVSVTWNPMVRTDRILFIINNHAFLIKGLGTVGNWKGIGHCCHCLLFHTDFHRAAAVYYGIVEARVSQSVASGERMSRISCWNMKFFEGKYARVWQVSGEAIVLTTPVVVPQCPSPGGPHLRNQALTCHTLRIIWNISRYFWGSVFAFPIFIPMILRQKCYYVCCRGVEWIWVPWRAVIVRAETCRVVCHYYRELNKKTFFIIFFSHNQLNLAILG